MTRLKEHLIMWPILIVLGSSLFALLYGIHSYLPQEAVYNCSIAEISPDFTPKMKEECRKLRASVK
jgi:hypothetical protein